MITARLTSPRTRSTTATALGLNLCFTPVRSPESNGIAEAFVKTFKRDYTRLSILQDAATIIMLLPAWFEDYNDVHPHSLSSLPSSRAGRWPRSRPSSSAPYGRLH